MTTKGGASKRIWLKDMAKRHPGMTKAMADHQCDAAAVCLARFHDLPPSKLRVQSPSTTGHAELVWKYPGEVETAANRNDDDATRDGAYAVALGTTDVFEGLATIGRARGRTGADWYLRPKPVIEPTFDIDQPDVVRLEVSGVSNDTEEKIRDRVRLKVAQAAAGKAHQPAKVAVIGFRTPRAVIRDVAK